jgi:hypothetical protein
VCVVCANPRVFLCLHLLTFLGEFTLPLNSSHTYSINKRAIRILDTSYVKTSTVRLVAVSQNGQRLVNMLHSVTIETQIPSSLSLLLSSLVYCPLPLHIFRFQSCVLSATGTYRKRLLVSIQFSFSRAHFFTFLSASRNTAAAHFFDIYTLCQQQQLNSYGFIKTDVVGIFFHPYFHKERGGMEFLSQIRRRGNSRSNSNSKQRPASSSSSRSAGWTPPPPPPPPSSSTRPSRSRVKRAAREQRVSPPSQGLVQVVSTVASNKLERPNKRNLANMSTSAVSSSKKPAEHQLPVIVIKSPRTKKKKWSTSHFEVVPSNVLEESSSASTPTVSNRKSRSSSTASAPPAVSSEDKEKWGKKILLANKKPVAAVASTNKTRSRYRRVLSDATNSPPNNKASRSHSQNLLVHTSKQDLELASTTKTRSRSRRALSNNAASNNNNNNNNISPPPPQQNLVSFTQYWAAELQVVAPSSNNAIIAATTPNTFLMNQPVGSPDDLQFQNFFLPINNHYYSSEHYQYADGAGHLLPTRIPLLRPDAECPRPIPIRMSLSDAANCTSTASISPLDPFPAARMFRDNRYSAIASGGAPTNISIGSYYDNVGSQEAPPRPPYYFYNANHPLPFPSTSHAFFGINRDGLDLSDCLDDCVRNTTHV